MSSPFEWNPGAFSPLIRFAWVGVNAKLEFWCGPLSGPCGLGPWVVPHSQETYHCFYFHVFFLVTCEPCSTFAALTRRRQTWTCMHLFHFSSVFERFVVFLSPPFSPLTSERSRVAIQVNDNSSLCVQLSVLL